MRTGKLPTALLVLALLLAIAAALVVLFAPLQTSTTVTFSPDGTATRTTTTSLLEEEGRRIVVFAVIPAVLVLIPVAVHAARARRAFLPAAAGAVLLLAVFVFLTGFSIGLLYGPALLTLIAALVVTAAPQPTPTSPRTDTPPG